jgi:tetratricopeptide (TPR) repeat protein
MIVKNEAALLGRCLASIRPAADQIVVVDTGSTDTTVEIARSFGAEIVTAEWKNDFAAARNVSLAHARCAWVLWLDADDVVPAESVPKIAELKKEKPGRVFGLIVRNERPNNTGTEFVQARMFPNRPEIRFERRVHEQMMPSALCLGLVMEQRDAVIEHHGYADHETLKRKARRNIALMLEDYDVAAPDPVTAVEIADSHLLIEEWGEATQWYTAVLRIPGVERTMPAIASQAHLGLGNLNNRTEHFAEAIRHLDETVRLAPWRTDARYLLAVSHDLAGSPDSAVACLRRILAAEESPGQVGVDFRAVRIKASLRLMRILTEQKLLPEAVAAVREALVRHPDRPEIALMAAKVLLAKGDLTESLRLFEKSLRIPAQANLDSYIGLCLIYRQAGRMPLARQTIETIGPQYGTLPRYWAFRRLFIDDRETVPPSFSGQDLDKERDLIKRDFFNML